MKYGYLVLIAVGAFAAGCSGNQNQTPYAVSPYGAYGTTSAYGASAYGVSYPPINGICTNPGTILVNGMCVVNTGYNYSGSCNGYGSSYFFNGINCVPQGAPAGAYAYNSGGQNQYLYPYQDGCRRSGRFNDRRYCIWSQM